MFSSINLTKYFNTSEEILQSLWEPIIQQLRKQSSKMGRLPFHDQSRTLHPTVELPPRLHISPVPFIFFTLHPLLLL
jgi:hypothetical protein